MPRLTRDVFVEQTCKLLNERGRTDFSLSDVLQSCGAQKGSLYHFFPEGKDELVVAAVGHLSDCAFAHVQSCLETKSTVASAVYKQLNDLANWIEAREHLTAIPFSAIAAITGGANVEVESACKQALARIESLYFGKLKSDGLSSSKAKSVATFIVVTTEGAFLLSKLHQSDQPLRLAATNLRAFVSNQFD
ncbi:MAG: TetR/AcrR family transcriptional regulator [Planctomycetota bacterium]